MYCDRCFTVSPVHVLFIVCTKMTVIMLPLVLYFVTYLYGSLPRISTPFVFCNISFFGSLPRISTPFVFSHKMIFHFMVVLVFKIIHHKTTTDTCLSFVAGVLKIKFKDILQNCFVGLN